MRTTDTGGPGTAAKLGTWMFLSWVLIVGPVGFVIWLALAYAMEFSNLALGVVCVLLLFTPVLFSAAWGIVLGAALIAERSAVGAALAPEKNSP